MSVKTAAKGKIKTGAEPPPLPSAMAQVVNWRDVTRACRISRRKFYLWLSTGLYPPPDFRVGNQPRWYVETHNAAVEAMRGKAV